jgi:hypothetical protein
VKNAGSFHFFMLVFTGLKGFDRNILWQRNGLEWNVAVPDACVLKMNMPLRRN